MISMFVVACITMAMVIVLSAFNGIDGLVKELFGSFTADITVLPVQGRTFESSEDLLNGIKEIPGTLYVSEIIEDDVWIRNGENNTVATVKGVEDNYGQVTSIDSMMIRGTFRLDEGGYPIGIAGLGVFIEIGAGYREGEHDIITINAPIRGKKLRKDREKAFNSMPLNLGGIYSINAELDVKYIFAPLDFCRELFGYENEISSIEVKVTPETDLALFKTELLKILPEGIQAQTRFEKNALVFQTTESEKYAVSLILLFILLIAAFNIIASLTMLIIEKKKDIFILSSYGATEGTIHRIFMIEGVMIYVIGAVAGLLLGIGLCLIQQNIGVVPLSGSMVDYYPVEIRGGDLVRISVAVLVVGISFSVLLTRYLVKRFATGN